MNKGMVSFHQDQAPSLGEQAISYPSPHSVFTSSPGPDETRIIGPMLWMTKLRSSEVDSVPTVTYPTWLVFLSVHEIMSY